MTEEALPTHLAKPVDMSKFARDEDLVKGRKMAEELAQLEADISSLKKQIAAKEERKLELQRREIPQFFDEVLRTDTIGLPDQGADLVVVPYYHANIKAEWPEDRRQRAFDWLEENGCGDIVAVVVSVEFARGELEDARELQELIMKSRFSNTHVVEMAMTTPWSTLTSTVKELHQSGKTIPMEMLGATITRQAKIVIRKDPAKVPKKRSK